MAEWPKLGMSALKASLWAMIVEGWLPRAAAVRPGGVALQTPDGTVSYAELLASASASAATIARRFAPSTTARTTRIRSDDSVALVGHHCAPPANVGSITTPAKSRAAVAIDATTNAATISLRT